MEFSQLSFDLFDEDFDDLYRISALEGEQIDNSSFDCFISLPSGMIRGTTSLTLPKLKNMEEGVVSPY